MEFNARMDRREFGRTVGRMAILAAAAKILPGGIAKSQEMGTYSKALNLLEKFVSKLPSSAKDVARKAYVVSGAQDFQFMSHGWSMEKERAWYKEEIEKRRSVFVLIETGTKGRYSMLEQTYDTGGKPNPVVAETVCYSDKKKTIYWGETIPDDPKAGGVGNIKRIGAIYFISAGAEGAKQKLDAAISNSREGPSNFDITQHGEIIVATQKTN